jgi:hypothetical protein
MVVAVGHVSRRPPCKLLVYAKDATKPIEEEPGALKYHCAQAASALINKAHQN